MTRKSRTRDQSAPPAAAPVRPTGRSATGQRQAPPTTAAHGGRFWLGLVLFQIAFGTSVFVLTRAHYDRASAVPVTTAAGPRMPGSPAAPASPRPPVALTASPSQPSPAAAPDMAQLPTPALIQRANQQFTDQDYGGAAVTYAAVVEREPGNVEMLNNLGISLHNAGRSLEGVARLEQALQIDPEHQRALLTLGFVQRALGDTAKAREALSRAVAVDQTSRVGQEAQRLLSEL